MGWPTCSSVLWVPMELNRLIEFIRSSSIPDKDDLGKIGSEQTDLPENKFLDFVLAKDIATVPLFVSIMDSRSCDSSFLGGTASSKIQFSGSLTCSHSIDFGTTSSPMTALLTTRNQQPAMGFSNSNGRGRRGGRGNRGGKSGGRFQNYQMPTVQPQQSQGQFFSSATCYNCNGSGHIARQCPSQRRTVLPPPQAYHTVSVPVGSAHAWNAASVQDNNVPESVHSSRGILGPPPVHLLPKVSSQREPNVVSNTEIISVASGSDSEPLPAPISNLSDTQLSPMVQPDQSVIVLPLPAPLGNTHPMLTRSKTVNRLAQYMHRPTEEHWQAVKRVLRYLQGTAEYGLLRPSSVYEISAYSDSDWAGSIEDRKSTTGFAIYLGRNLVSWASKKQRSVSRSSTEAEYRAIANTTSEFNLRGCIR
ncbi:hypothetical protein GH714_008124 [Hevea brasiliensis]|uniref:CCHC-type domain-containing protein n=1 Tax=Hevea brasiliensis TaxID=3981 RepID=A0A6A6KHY0_HEVBR|nr:hypothetical protein GH714_008124 [Hevea brasiliensis]